MKIHSKKHMKFFSALVIGSVSLFALSGCNSEARYSEHLEWDGTLTQEEPAVEESVTIKFSLTYGGAIQDASNWATLYAEGSWSLKDGSEDWEDPVALDWNNSSQTYDLTLTNVAHGDYECQLLFGYNHLETYDWDYRVTTENLSVTIDSSEVTVPVTLDKEVTSIIPEYKAELSGYTLSFTFKYGEGTATVPSYADVYIAGSWDNEGDDWDNFHALTPGDNNTYTYSLSETALKAGETYTYGLVLVYSGDTPSWTYEVKTSSDKYIYIYGTEGDNHIESIEIVLNEDFSTTIPEPINNYTLTISISYDGTTEYIPDYVDLYISGDFNEWSETDKITTYSNDRYSFTYTIETVHVGTEYKYQIIAVREGEAFSWSNSLTPSSDQVFTPVTGETGKTITYEATISIDDLVPDLTEADTYTVVVSLLDYSGNNPLVSNGDYYVYLNSNITTTGSDWDTHKMTYDSDSQTYRYTYESIPAAGDYEIALYGGDSTNANWDKKIGSTSVTVGSGLTGSQESETISIHTPYDSLDDYMTSSTYTITIGNLGAAPDGIHVYAAGDFNGWWDDSGTDWQGFQWGDPVELTSSGDNYILSLDFTPSASSTFEILCDNSNVSGDDKWTHVLSSGLTFSSTTITASTTYTDWNSSATGVYPPSSGGGSGSGDTGSGEVGDNTSFYFVGLYETSTSIPQTTANIQTTDYSQEYLFGGNSTSSLTTTTVSAQNNGSVTYGCFYNSTVGVAAKNSTHIAYFYSGSWANQITLNSITIPETNSGTIAIYLFMYGYYYEDNNVDNGWYSYWTNFSFSSGSAVGGWNTNYSGSITDFIALLTGSISWS